jgi:hypothetical protein
LRIATAGSNQKSIQWPIVLFDVDSEKPSFDLVGFTVLLKMEREM